MSFNYKFRICCLLLTSLLNADFLTCSDIYTTTTVQKTNKPFDVNGDKGNGHTKITLEFNDKHIYLHGKDKTELLYIGKGTSNIYMIEETTSGNLNLYSLFADNILTISKSYDVFGLAKMNIQTIYQCKKKQ